MNIAITISYFQPEIGYAESKLAELLTAAGHQVEVITSDHYFPFPDFESSVSSVLGSRIQPAIKKKYKGYWIDRKSQLFEVFARSFFGGINDSFKAIKPDIVISFGVTAPATYITARLKQKYNFRFIAVDSHLPSELERGEQFSKKLFYLLFRAVFSKLLNKQLDKVIALQEATATIIRESYGIDKNVQVIPHGSDLNEFYFDLDQRKKIRSALKIKNNTLAVIYTGKVVKAKGVKLLFNALQLLLKQKVNVCLVIVGDGSSAYKQECLNELDENYHSKVLWQGFIDQKKLYQYYSAADVAVWPLQESLAMNDAAACNLPFIANHTIGTKVRISNNNALLYKQHNASDLAKKIKLLYDHPTLRKKMGKNGRELIEQKLNWQKLAEEFIKV